MKSNLILTIVASVCIISLSACGGSKRFSDNYSGKTKGSPFGDVYDSPCIESDSETEFAATGIASGSRHRMGEVHSMALADAQGIVRQKMQHAYKGAIFDYTNSVGTNTGTDIEAKIEGGGTQMIDRIINDTREACGPKFSSVDDKGNVTCYVGIRISKKEIAAKLAEAVANQINDDEELKIRFKEQEFRKRMEESFRNFKEDSK
ncbi:MAG: hypothetical protein LBM07_01280 [Culturomica sp.]|jgi:hypothetical protein|nr:hypothetical protein [Culturomica sp.]